MESLAYSKYWFVLSIIVMTFIVLLTIQDKLLLPWKYRKTYSQPRYSPHKMRTSQHSTELTTKKPRQKSGYTTQKSYPIHSFIPNPEKTFVKSSKQRILSKHPLTRFKIGNQLFMFASLYGIARKNNITPTIRGDPNRLKLFNIFRVPTQPDTLPLPHTVKVFTETAYGKYDSRTETLYQNNTHSIHLDEYFQSWKYFKHVETEIRQQLTLLPQARQRAEDHIKEIIPEKFKNRKYTKVGVHVRLGDMTEKKMINLGYNIAPVRYFYNAMDFYKKKFTYVIFIVCSNDMTWTTSHIKGENVFYAHTRDGQLHFMTLTIMDHIIQSVGTFGWWAAWIVNGTSVYYKYPFRANSKLATRFNSEDFFLPDWIPMT